MQVVADGNATGGFVKPSKATAKTARLLASPPLLYDKTKREEYVMRCFINAEAGIVKLLFCALMKMPVTMTQKQHAMVRKNIPVIPGLGNYWPSKKELKLSKKELNDATNIQVC